MTKILVIGPTPPPVHGVSQAIDSLLHSKLRERFQLFHLDLADRRGIEYVNKPDIYDLFLFLKQWGKLLVLCLKHRPEITYLPISQTTIGFLRDSFLILTSLFWKSNIVLHLHSGNFRSWYEKSGVFTKIYVKFILARISRMIVLGQTLKPLFDGLVAPARLSVVPNGIRWDQARVSSLPEREKKRKIRVLHLSTLTKLKGTMILLKSVPKVVSHFTEVEFVFAGNWYRKEEKEEGELMIAREGLSRFVYFAGEVRGKDKRELFESSDLFVFPGIQQEGQPLVIIEAMAAGLPVIFTDRGSIRETVLNGVNGLEVAIDHPEDLADKILWLLTQPEERKRMGREGRIRYEKGFTQNHHEINMIHVFDKVCEEIEGLTGIR